MNGIIFILIFATIPHEGRTLTESVPSVEVNHMHHECGEESFCQLIFDEPESILFWNKDVLWVYHPTPKLYWWDGDRLRIVTVGAFQETWTYHDREQEARGWLPVEERKGLRR